MVATDPIEPTGTLTGSASSTADESMSDCELRSLSFSVIVPLRRRRGGAGKAVISECGFDSENVLCRSVGLGLLDVGDIFRKSSANVEFVSIGLAIFRKLRSFVIVVMGSPITGETGDGGSSLSDDTEETVTRGGEPGNAVGGPILDLKTPGLDGALFMRKRSLNEYLMGTGVSDGVGGRGPVGGGAGGVAVMRCFDDEVPLLKLRR